MRRFPSREQALYYGWSELLDTLRDDLERMKGADSEHYTDDDRTEMAERIADLEELESDVILRPSPDDAWQICRSSPGMFGVFYDAQEICTVMDGWAEEDDSDNPDPDGHFFDWDDPDDRAALLAWCKREGPSFEDTFSTIVGDNAPTRAEAFDALAEARVKESSDVEG